MNEFGFDKIIRNYLMKRRLIRSTIIIMNVLPEIMVGNYEPLQKIINIIITIKSLEEKN